MPRNEQNATNFDIAAVNEDLPALDSIDLKIVGYILQNPASTDAEISTAVGVSRQTINRRKNSEPVQSKLRHLLSLPETEVRRLSVLALRKVEDILRCGDPRLEFGAAVALLKLSERFIAQPSIPCSPTEDGATTYILRWADELPQEST